ncbi:type I secretion system permease/ATPase [Aestuariispira ectoiniformans]|uniref:type I secretion system permease/ATPase n=1 Tax=Aestuariispira ectoiniformans TaxID=2775080 RepID=UPI00223C0C07|nr:type I secretion system permease/ATPase [Aestuariispira ectoiniformans]
MWTRLNDKFLYATRRCKRALFVAFIFGLFINLFQFTIPLYMMQMFDRVVPSSSLDTLLYLTIIAIFALFIMMLLETARSRVLSRTGAWFEEYLSLHAFDSALTASLQLKGYSTDATRDLYIVRSFLAGNAVTSLLDAPWIPIFVIVAFMLHPTFGVITVIGAVIMFGFALLNEFVTKKPMIESSEASREAHRRISSATRHPEAIDAMGMLRGMASKWFEANTRSLASHLVSTERSSMVISGSKFVRMVIQISILASGAMLVLEGHLTPGVTVASSIIIGRALAPVEHSITSWRSLIQTRDSLAKLGRMFASAEVRSEGMKLPEPKGHLRVESINHLLPGSSRYLLRNVSFGAEPGEAVVITGPSTAGKSTLARMLVGTLRPTSGTVRLDNADVYDWDRTEFGKYVGYLPQSNALYAGTVRENIGRMTDADWGKVVIAAKQANCHDMILRMPQGYDTPIGESGMALSGGQRQRIGLARALFGDPKYVVLDEPDSELDIEGETALTKAITELKARGSTVIIIAHRSNILRVADKVCILSEGQVRMFGPRDEVLAKLRQGARPPAPPTPIDQHRQQQQDKPALAQPRASA